MSFRLDRALERRSAPFILPARARQGPRVWYLIKLHFRISFSPRTGEGFAYVSGLTNGRSAAQIKFDTEGPDRPTVWHTLD
jgi:hypothetical protein